MNRCKQCNVEYEPKRVTSQYCSAACRVKAGRVSVTDDVLSVTEVSVTSPGSLSVTPPPRQVIDRVASTIQASIDRQAQEVQFNVSASKATRTNPGQLNYGKPLSLHGLTKAGLKANRVPIPGDHDYSGVCEQVEGKWIAPNKDRTRPEQRQDG